MLLVIMFSHHSIGIFDSGVGGLSVAKDIQRTLPFESLVYVADSGFAPYGDQSAAFIANRCHRICQFFISQQVKAIVIACNTATVSCVAELRASYSLPIVGLEPAIKPAAINSKSAVVGVLATAQTVQSSAVTQLIERFGDHTKIILQGCPGLVERVEQADIYSQETRELLKEYLQPMLSAGADTIVMGCTHYAFLIPLIQKIIGPEITLLTSGQALSKQLHKRLSTAQLLNSTSHIQKLTFYSSSATPKSAAIISQLWGETVPLNALIECQSSNRYSGQKSPC